MKRVIHLGSVDASGLLVPACGDIWVGASHPSTGNLPQDASMVTCHACLAAMPEERAAKLAHFMEHAALDGPNILYDIAVRVTRTEVVKVRVPRGEKSLEQAERVAVLTARGRGADVVYIAKTKVVDKRHPRK